MSEKPTAAEAELARVLKLVEVVINNSSTSTADRSDGPFYYVSQRDLDALEGAITKRCQACGREL